MKSRPLSAIVSTQCYHVGWKRKHCKNRAQGLSWLSALIELIFDDSTLFFHTLQWHRHLAQYEWPILTTAFLKSTKACDSGRVLLSA
eukprot:5537703-Amphidinium_carterae.1